MITNEYEALTPEAQDFQKEVEAALRPIVARNHGKFTYREMAYLAIESVSLVAAEQTLRWAVEKRQRAKGTRWEMVSECDEHCANCHRPFQEHLQPELKCPSVEAKS